MTPSPHYDPSRCDRCGLCVSACPCHAISLSDEGVVFGCERCSTYNPGCPTLIHCLWPCEEACPTGAIQCPFDILWPDDGNTETPDQP